jgi:hypothetical protein
MPAVTFAIVYTKFREKDLQIPESSNGNQREPEDGDDPTIEGWLQQNRVRLNVD